MSIYYAVAMGGCRGIYHNRAEFDLAMIPEYFINAATQECKTVDEAEEFLDEYPDKSVKKGAYYAVGTAGLRRKKAVFDHWDKCKKFLDAEEGFKKFKKFPTLREALDFVWEVQSERPTKRKRTEDSEPPSKKPKTDLPQSVLDNMPTVYTDGACSNNGRWNAKAGYGIFWGDDHPDNTSAPISGGKHTNNRAEYEAVNVALGQAVSKGLPAIRICTDSKLLVNSMGCIKRWELNGWKTWEDTDVANRDLLESIQAHCQKIHVEFQHVRGHAGIHGNEMADRLATRNTDGRGGQSSDGDGSKSGDNKKHGEDWKRRGGDKKRGGHKKYGGGKKH